MVVEIMHERPEAGLVSIYWPSFEEMNDHEVDTDMKCVYGVPIRVLFRSGRWYFRR